MLTLFLDTHVAVFVHQGDAQLLSPPAKHLLNAAGTISLSPMSAL